MVARGAGDVGCAHCTKFGAANTCRVCKLQVCDACAADWTTCTEPAGRELRLGMGWRLRDVDPIGRLALVSHALRAPRIVNLRHTRWVGPAPMGLNLYNLLRSSPPRLTSDGLLVHAEVSLANSDSTYIDGVHWHTVEGGHWIQHIDDVEGPHGATAVSAVDDVFAYVTATQRVVVMRHTGPPYRFVSQTVEPLPRKVISAIAIDGERDRLASATWREIAIHSVHAGVSERIEHVDTGIDSNITWLALSGRWLAYSTGYRLEVRPLKDGGTADAVRYQYTGVGAAALSRDGAYLALAFGDRLVLHDLERDQRAEFTEHSDAISYIRFASDDHMVISGDDDNRIVMRPRTPAGYAKPIVDVELAG